MNLDIGLTLFLLVLSWGIVFSLGYIKGSWNQIDNASQRFRDLENYYQSIVESLNKRLNDSEGEGWKYEQ